MEKKEIKKESNITNYIPNKAIISSVNACFNVPKNEEVFIKGEKIIKYNKILLGDSCVGKTSIFSRLENNSFREYSFATLGHDVTTYFIKYKNQKYKLIIHDTSGHEKYKAITKNFMRGKDAVLFVYDISNQESFDGIKSWYDLYKEQNKEVVGLLIGNKCDIEKKVEQKKVDEFSKKFGLDYIETSAKLNKRIRRIIISLLNKIRKYNEKVNLDDKRYKENERANSISLNSTDADSSIKIKNPKRKCC